MIYTKITFTSLALLASTAVLTADTLFSFGGDYASGNLLNARRATGSGTGPYLETVAFDDSAVMSPSSGYTGPTYYGGFEFSSSTVNGIISREGIRDYAAADPIYYQSYNADGWEGSELSLHLAVLFKQEDWLSGHQSGANSVTGLSLSTNAFSAGTGRFLVQIGGDYYVSNSTVIVSGAQTLELDVADLLLETWAEYDPNSNLNFDQSATFAALNLNDVTAAGFYIERDSWTGSSGPTPYGLGIDAFSISGTTIPEPSSMAVMLGLVGFVMSGCLRRRHI